MSFIPYKSRAGEEGYFKPVEMSSLEIFTEITAFEHAYYFNNCDPAFRHYMLYAGTASGKLLINQPGAIFNNEDTLAHWQDQLRQLGPELDIYGFSIIHKDPRTRANGKQEVGFVVYTESRKHRAKVFYVPMLDAEEVQASGKQIQPMFKTWMPGGVYPTNNRGWFLLNDEDDKPVPSVQVPEPEFVAFGPAELALRNLGNILFKSDSPFYSALIVSIAGVEDKHVMVEADELDALHTKVWNELHRQVQANDAFRGYSFAVDAFLTGEAPARNQVYLVQSEFHGVPATIKAYKMMKVVLFDKPIALMQDPGGQTVFERPPARTLFTQGE